MFDHIVLDIESPNFDCNSISAIGIVVVKNNKIVDTIYSLINPEDEFIEETIQMTGITPDMVKHSPKFNEFWPIIEDLLLKYPIVCHNVSYDLGVISRNLHHYGIKVPRFTSLCTLKLSRERMDLNCHGLEYLMNELGYEYNAHNALSDAEATEYLFNQLNDIKEITVFDQETFFLRNLSKKEINDNLTSNFNEIYGLTMSLKYKDKINDNHKQLLVEWIDKNVENNEDSDINKIIEKLQFILKKDNLTKKDANKIASATSFVSKSNKFSKVELNHQVLKGILHMINSDEEILYIEYDFLSKWLNYFELPEEVNKEEILNNLNDRII